MQRLKLEQKARIGICNGQRRALAPIAAQEPALEVRTPYLVGNQVTVGREIAARRYSPAFYAIEHKTVMFQLLVNRAEGT